MPRLPLRQVHLDFHTSPAIPGVGRAFDGRAFVEQLRRARVQSVTCFSRCHHGLIYHDTERFPELRHPGLCCDLLAEQLAACHEAGIRAPIYISVGWDHAQATAHPGWLERRPDGAPVGPGPLEPGFTHKLCLASPHAEFVLAQTEEVLQRFPAADGLFFDIVLQGPCACARCVAAMDAAGLDPTRREHRLRHAAGVLDRFRRRLGELVRSRAPGASVFFNSGHVGPETARAAPWLTHLELESLPTGHWGYLHFPISARYARGLGLPLVGMTAAFHTTWGDFGSFKPRPALEYECFSMLAHGAGCSVGDQLHPEGTLCRATYELIGAVFEQVEAREPWCLGARPYAEIALFHPECFGAADPPLVDRTEAGAAQILWSGHHQFDCVAGGAELQRYRVLVIPDRIRVGPELAASLRAYLEQGGAIVAAHQALLQPAADAFALDEVGARCHGPAPHEPDYLVPGPELSRRTPATALVMYRRAMRVSPRPGTEVWATVRAPYFERTRERFCGHRQAPPARDAGYPAVIRRGRLVYFAHPVFEIYRRHAPAWCRDLVLDALDALLPEPLVRTDAPPGCRVTVTCQPGQRRVVVHLLHYPLAWPGEGPPAVEPPVPLHELALGLRVEQPPQAVQLAPGERGHGEALPHSCRDGYAWVTIPRLCGHAMVAFVGANPTLYDDVSN